MSLWDVAYCTKPIGQAFEPDRLNDAMGDADFSMMAETHDLDDEAGEAAGDSLRFEAVDKPDRHIVLMHYRHHEKGDMHIHCERHVDPGFVREDVASRLEESLPKRVRASLLHAIETVAFDLKQSDWDGMGLPLAYQVAMRLAGPKCGDGVVGVEREWWDPKTYRQLEATT
jgi:hypothetical protein